MQATLISTAPEALRICRSNRLVIAFRGLRRHSDHLPNNCSYQKQTSTQHSCKTDDEKCVDSATHRPLSASCSAHLPSVDRADTPAQRPCNFCVHHSHLLDVQFLWQTDFSHWDNLVSGNLLAHPTTTVLHSLSTVLFSMRSPYNIRDLLVLEQPNFWTTVTGRQALWKICAAVMAR